MLIARPLFRFSRAVQDQRLRYQINGARGVGAMLSGARAAARMMRNLNQRQVRDAEKFRFSPAQCHENRLAKGYRWFALLLQFDGVVDTPRSA
jgi:hypothetical protein